MATLFHRKLLGNPDLNTLTKEGTAGCCIYMCTFTDKEDTQAVKLLLLH